MFSLEKCRKEYGKICNFSGRLQSDRGNIRQAITDGLGPIKGLIRNHSNGEVEWQKVPTPYSNGSISGV